jgi:hypothetical protein
VNNESLSLYLNQRTCDEEGDSARARSEVFTLTDPENPARFVFCESAAIVFFKRESF